jgi:hypothetical protein
MAHATITAGSDLDHYGTNTGHAADPRNDVGDDWIDPLEQAQDAALEAFASIDGQLAIDGASPIGTATAVSYYVDSRDIGRALAEAIRHALGDAPSPAGAVAALQQAALLMAAQYAADNVGLFTTADLPDDLGDDLGDEVGP